MRTKEELIAEVISYRDKDLGRTKLRYPLELKKECLKAVSDGMFLNATQFCRICGLVSSSICNWQRTIDKKIHMRTVPHGISGVRHSISTKIQCVEMVLHERVSVKEVSEKTGISSTSITKWLTDYQAGLYSLENVTQVSRKKFKTYEILLGELDKIKSNLYEKKNEIKEALKKEYEDKLSLVQ